MMEATKENCRKVIGNLQTARREAYEAGLGEDGNRTLMEVQEFLDKVSKRLPSQAAIDRDKERRKKKESK
jgi:hypothetical protein